MTQFDFCMCQHFLDGYSYLYSITHEVIFVHAACGLPSFAIWQQSEKYCEECGASFSSPVELLCRRCHRRIAPKGTVWSSWKVLWEMSQNILTNLGNSWSNEHGPSVVPT